MRESEFARDKDSESTDYIIMIKVSDNEPLIEALYKKDWKRVDFLLEDETAGYPKCWDYRKVFLSEAEYDEYRYFNDITIQDVAEKDHVIIPFEKMLAVPDMPVSTGVKLLNHYFEVIYREAVDVLGSGDHLKNVEWKYLNRIELSDREYYQIILLLSKIVDLETVVKYGDFEIELLRSAKAYYLGTISKTLNNRVEKMLAKWYKAFPVDTGSILYLICNQFGDMTYVNDIRERWHRITHEQLCIDLEHHVLQKKGVHWLILIADKVYNADNYSKLIIEEILRESDENILLALDKDIITRLIAKRLLETAVSKERFGIIPALLLKVHDEWNT